MKLIMTRGLPASGKSTWAKEQVIASGGRTKRVNKDDLRAMIDNSVWSKQNEKNVLAVRDYITKHYLLLGNDVIVDDTNLTPNHEKRLSEIAGETGAIFEIKSFLDVPLATCIIRNAQRVNPVPETAIRSMYKSFVKPKAKIADYVKPPYNPDLPNCIIVDIDGTVAHMNGRSPYDYNLVNTDIVDENVANIVRRYAQRDIMEMTPDTYIIIVSGRDDTCKDETLKWLADNHIPFDEFYMRDHTLVDEKGNKLDDTIIKKNIYEDMIKPRFNVRFVLDDRDRVVKMWREQGLKVLQVAEGDF